MRLERCKSVRGALAALLLGASSAAAAGTIRAPLGARWSMSPQEAQTQLSQLYKWVGPNTSEPELFLHEQRYAGEALGMPSDHIAPMFFGGRLFAIAASWSPSPEAPASYLWEQAVAKLTAQLGKPKSRTRPLALLSLEAVLKLLPDQANKTLLMELYNAADRDRKLGGYVILDLQIQVGSWVPEAVWELDDGVTVRAVMRAGDKDASTILKALKPAVVYAKPDVLK